MSVVVLYFHIKKYLTKANLPYMLWTISYNITYLLGFFTVQSIFFRNPNKTYAEAVPWTLEAVNNNGLFVFLLV